MFGKFRSWMRLRAIADTVWSEVAAGVLPPVRVSIPVAPAALMLKTPPAKGAIPSRPSSFLLDASIMAQSPILPRSTSRHQLSVCVSGRNDIPQSHHGVVFVHHEIGRASCRERVSIWVVEGEV